MGGALGWLCLAAAFASGCAPAPQREAADAQATALRARAERAAGRAFTAPVAWERVSEDELGRRIASEVDRVYSQAQLRDVARALQALGLLGPGQLDLRETLLAFAADSLAGFYSPASRRLFVVAGHSEGPALGRDSVRIVVHELVHALQHSVGPIMETTVGLRQHDDLAFALAAVLEGHALWAEARDAAFEYREAPPTPAQLTAALGPAATAALYPEVPRAVREPMLLTYPLGYGLLSQVTRGAGEGAPSRAEFALLSPPLSSEQLLHPDKWLSPERADPPLFLAFPSDFAPTPGCRALERNTLGELGLRIWLGERTAPSEIEDPDLERAAAGWGGDRVAVYECPDGAAFVWLLRMDSEKEARELEPRAREAARGLRERGGLRAEARVARDGRDVWVHAGLDPAALERLRGRVGESAYADLAAYLAAHPDVLERAARMRER